MNKKFIKTITCLCLTIICLNGLNFRIPKSTKASQTLYYRITDTTTPFFSSVEDTQVLFYLPYTYYVKVISKGEIFYHVEYSGADGVTIDGYVPNQTLFLETQEVFSPYPQITITTSKTAILYADSQLTKSIKFIFKERQLTYYGNFILPDGTQCFYVNYGGDLGYVKESDVVPFTLNNHPNPLTFIPEESPPIEELPTTEPDTVKTLRIIIISCLILAGLSGLIVVIKKRPTVSLNTYYDENDYE